MIKKAIITGPTGAIGSALIDELIKNGVYVYAIIRPNSPRKNNILKNPLVEIVDCDISDYQSLHGKLCSDAFFHLAWEKTTVSGRDDVDAQLKNVSYALDAVRLAKASGCKVFVGAGSQAEYGVKDCKLKVDTAVNPSSAYGIAKYTAGKMTENLCNKYGIRHCWVRILSIYGKNDGANTLMSYLINSFKNGVAPDLTACEQIWDYLHSEDAGRAFRLIAERGKGGKVYPLGGGEPKPLREYVESVRNVVNPNCAINFGAKEYYPHQPMYLCADITELTLDTGFIPVKDFETSIKEIAGI